MSNQLPLHLIEEFHPTKNGNLQPESLTIGSNRKIWWLISECGHEFESRVFSRVRGSGCSVCAGKIIVVGQNDLLTTHPDVAAQWHPTLNQGLDPTEVTAGSNRRVWWVCEQGHEWEVKISNRIKGTSKFTGCPICSNKTVLPGFNDLLTTHSIVAAQWHPTKNQDLTPSQVTAGSNRKVWWVCDKGHEWQTSVNNRAHRKQTGCPVCAGYYSHETKNINDTLIAQWHPTKNKGLTPQDVSKGSDKIVSNLENELYEFFTKLGIKVKQSDRSVLKNIPAREIDLYFPDYKIGVEFNGLYWHSETTGKDRNYHYNKYQAAQQAGIQLIQIWEDDWNKRKPIILKAISNKLGIMNLISEYSVDRVFARKTEVDTLTTLEAQLFLEANHIQGFASGSYYVGLKDNKNQELVALMVLRKEPNNTLNIVRYATSQQVVGGFTKLLKYAEREYAPARFITFADHTISDGGLYENNGFTADKELPPDYMYVIKGERKHKFGYRLKRFRNDPELLWEEGLSERELALLNNLPRIWDAGKTRYVKELNNS